MAATSYQVPEKPVSDPGTGYRFGSFTHLDGANTVHKDAIVICDSAGNIIDTLASAPAGTERALVTRNIPSGTQNVADGGSSLTVDAPVGTPLYARLSDGAANLIGQKAMASSLPVTLASDQSALSVASHAITDGGSSLTVDAPTGTPLPTRIGDGTNQVTLASANLAGTEQALPVRAFIQGAPQTSASGQITAAQPTPGTPVTGGTVGGATDYSTAGNLSFTLSGGGGAAGSVLLFEASDDGGTTWFPLSCKAEDSGVSVAGVTVIAGMSRAYSRSLIGFNRFRVRCTTFVASSTPNIRIDPGTLAFEPVISAVPSKPATQAACDFGTVVAGVTGVTAEALLSLVPVRDGVAGAGATAHSPTAGKAFKATALSIAVQNGAATQNGLRVYLRINPAGTATATSPIHAMIGISAPNAVSGGMTGNTIPLDIDMKPGWSFGLTQIAAIASGTMHAHLIGYEY